MTPYSPISLPEGYTHQKVQLHADSIVVLAVSTDDPQLTMLFVRKRDSETLRPVALSSRALAKDFVAFPSLGVFILTASVAERGGGRTAWDDFQILNLSLDSFAIRTVYSSENWERRGVSFPISFLGCSPDGRRLALACGQHVSPGNSAALDYRIGFLDPISGELELAERLPGLVF